MFIRTQRVYLSINLTLYVKYEPIKGQKKKSSEIVHVSGGIIWDNTIRIADINKDSAHRQLVRTREMPLILVNIIYICKQIMYKVLGKTRIAVVAA